jgi:two-component system LytT family sensor kinase
MSLVLSWLRSIRITYTFWWLVWIAIYTLILERLGYSWDISITDSLVSNVLLGLVCLAVGNTIRYYQPSKNTAWKLIVWSLLLSAIWVFLAQWLLSLIFSNEIVYLDNLKQSMPVRYAVGFLSIGCTMMIVWIWEFVAYRNEDSSRQAAAQALAKEAELTGLTQQLQPHFLFNSLNSISALIGSRPQEARLMIQQLSDFLRGTLKKDNRQLVPLSEEIKQLELYLAIEKVRFGHRLSTVFDCDEQSLALQLPPLILQPIIENAIKFGLYDTIGQVEINIRSRADKSSLIVSIKNPFDPQTSATIKGTGFGLKSVSRRLYLLYARNDLLKIETENNLYISTLSFPQHI